MKMNYYLAFILQMMLWSFYTVARWFSKGDSEEFHWLLFIMFLYLSFLLAKKLLSSARRGMSITFITLTVYFTLQLILNDTGVIRLIG